MIELRAPKNLLDLLRPEIYAVSNAEVEVSLDHPDVKDDSFAGYFFKFDGSVHSHSDKPAKPGQLPQHIRVFADACAFPSCRAEFIPHCLNLGYLLAEKDSIVIKMMADYNLRHYEVLRASPGGVLLSPEPYVGWNLLSSEKIDKIRELCLK